MSDPMRIHWSLPRLGDVAVGSPDPARWESLGFPPPWPDRPWIFGVMVASANGVVTWRRRGPADDPVLEILGGADRPERIADRRHMRYLRTIGDAGIGAQTVREQPRLVLTPQEPGDETVPELYAFRVARGLSCHPRNVVYSLYGRLPLAHPIFNTPALQTIVVTSPAGAAVLRGPLALVPTLPVIAEPVTEREGFVRAHQRLFAEHRIRYLACEGGQTVLSSLRAAGLLDEVFLTAPRRRPPDLRLPGRGRRAARGREDQPGQRLHVPALALSGGPAVTPPPDAAAERALRPRHPHDLPARFTLPERLRDRGVTLAGFLDELGGQPDLPAPARSFRIGDGNDVHGATSTGRFLRLDRCE